MNSENEDRGTRKPAARIAGVKERGELKTARIPIKIVPQAPQRKPDWIRVKAGNATGRFGEIKKMLREQKLHTVCEEAACPNIGECFGRGTATFMILGDVCTRRCPFCDVGHGKPLPPDVNEPANLADSVARLQLRYVVITSVDRDDLRDGGAQHFVDVIRAVRRSSPVTTIETLVPDFRGRMEIALEVLGRSLPDVLNHNMETVPRLYRQARPGADYAHSLAFMKGFKARYPQIPTKSGLMVGLGETDDEVEGVMEVLREADVDFLTIGQYLQPTRKHAAIDRFVTPERFADYKRLAEAKGFLLVAATPLTRSSYHATEDFERLKAARLASLRA